jgi:hypothetical protein
MRTKALDLGWEVSRHLGGAYAVSVHLHDPLRQRLGHPVELEDIVAGKYGTLAREITVSCASDGNHGRAVAAGAKALDWIGSFAVLSYGPKMTSSGDPRIKFGSRTGYQFTVDGIASCASKAANDELGCLRRDAVERCRRRLGDIHTRSLIQKQYVFLFRWRPDPARPSRFGRALFPYEMCWQPMS